MMLLAVDMIRVDRSAVDIGLTVEAMWEYCEALEASRLEGTGRYLCEGSMAWSTCKSPNLPQLAFGMCPRVSC